MVTTRKNTFCHFKVVVLNPNIVPTQMDVVIGSRLFELQFEIEPFDNANVLSVAATRNDGNGDDNTNQQKGKEKYGRNKNYKTDQPPTASTSNFQQTELGKDNSQSEMKKNEFIDDMEEDDLLDKE